MEVEDLPALADGFFVWEKGGLDPRRLEGRVGSPFEVRGEWAVSVKSLPGAPAETCSTCRRLGIVVLEGRGLVSCDDAFHHHPAEGLVAAARRGDVTAVAIGRRGDCLVVRSAGGRVPVYVHASPGRVAVATRLAPLVACLDKVEPDLLTASLWTAGYGVFPDGRTTVVGVTCVARGATMKVAATASHVARYWTPELRDVRPPTPGARSEHVARFREELLGYLQRETPTAGTLLSLSGGTDSGSLLALLRGSLGAEVSTVSFVPPFEPVRSRELDYIESLLHRYDVRDSTTMPITSQLVADALRGSEPLPLPAIHPVLSWLDTLGRDRGFATLVGGEQADVVVGSRVLSMPDLRDVGLLRGLRPIKGRRWLGQARDLVRHVAEATFLPVPLDLPSGVVRDVAEEFTGWRSEWHRAVQLVPRGLRALHASLQADGWLAMNWEVCARLGVRRVTPFHHMSMLQLAYELHPTERVGGYDKLVLRRALSGLVPARTLFRVGKDAAVGAPTPRERPSQVRRVSGPPWLASNDGLGDRPLAVAVAEHLWTALR